jgi:hypothetical protein
MSRVVTDELANAHRRTQKNEAARRRPHNPERRDSIRKTARNFVQRDRSSSLYLGGVPDPCPIVLSSGLVFPVGVIAVIESGLITIMMLF